jgi:N-methylhydantoinase A
MMEIAFDIGGTFTDFVLRDPQTGQTDIWKVPTTSREPARAVLDGLSARFRDTPLRPQDVVKALHATTIATNAILERKGCRTALLTTAGFRDILLIGRQKRYDTNNLHLDKPRPLVRRADIFEVPERLAADGSVLQALDDAAAAAIAEQIAEGGYQSVAIVFLHAYANPVHEQLMASALAARMPRLHLSLSSIVAPKYREYERTSTTVANAYVAPLVEDYVSSLRASLRDLGVSAEMSIMQSNGGVASAELACTYPIRIVESGPAAGVLMCAHVGREEACSHVMTFDMGGTTAKLGAIDDGTPAVASSFEVDAVHSRKGSGLPLSIMAIDLLEIGAGGGSIARTAMGLIRVGPDSAGAEPGPICYGRGGTQPTITDANLVLGYLNPGFFNGGAMRLEVAKAAEAIERDIAQPLGLTLEGAAWGVHSIANANMERAMRIVSIERGRDPRRYALVAFGGAGPLHACRLARAMEIPRVIVPRGAGVGSALGLLVADKKVDQGVTRVMRLNDAGPQTLAALFATLEARVTAEARRMEPDGALRLERSASMRYAGQGYELRVELPDGAIGPDYVARGLEAFHAAYQREYGYSDPDAPVEVTDWYAVSTSSGHADAAAIRLQEYDSGGNPVVGHRLAYFPEADGMVETAVVDRYALNQGHRIPGPALVEERESTVVVLPGDVVSVSPTGNLVVEIKAVDPTGGKAGIQ